jgi:YgiT-type zinc finger domain-containing protein
MKCVVCKDFEIKNGTTTITLMRGELQVRIKNVPARICPHCGEVYVDEKVAARLLVTNGDE